MTTGARLDPPPDGALVRVLVSGEAWAEGIPPVPGGCEVTVSFVDGESALVHGDALALLGYRVVGVQPHRLADAAAADFLVREAILHAHPTWWRALADQADRAFNLAVGPVAASLSQVLARHQRAAQSCDAAG